MKVRPVMVLMVLHWATIGSSGHEVHFHCERSGQHCVHPDASCNLETGQCENCPSGFDGYNCGFNTTLYTTVGCGLNCLNNATCYTNAVDELCLCTPDFFGTTCHMDRVVVTCTGENMTVTVTPMLPFEGQMYLGGLDPNMECHLESNDGKEFGLTLPLDSTCNPVIANDSLTGDVTYSRELTLQYAALFQSGHDLSINVTCFHSANHTREPVHTLGDPHTSKSQGGRIQTLYQPAQLAVVYPVIMSHVTGVVTVGERLTLFNYLNDDSVFKKLSVQRCVVSNPSFSKMLTIVTNGCPTDVSQALGLTQAQEHSSPPGVKYEFSMIRFGTEKQVMFSCVVKMCEKEDDPTCQMVNCSSSSSRRRREAMKVSDFDSRDVIAVDANEQVTRTSLIVLDPNKEEDLQISSEACLRDSTIQAVVVSLSSIIALSLVLCCVITLYLRLGRKGRLIAKQRSSDSLSRAIGVAECNKLPCDCHIPESANCKAMETSSIGSARFSLPSVNLNRY